MAEQQIIVNELDLRRAREDLAGLCSSLDAKRPMAWQTYGYSQTVSFEMTHMAYSRSGAAQGAVHRILDMYWQDAPRVKSPAADQAGAWETRVDQILSKVNALAKLRKTDRRNLVGRDAGLVYRAADGKPLSAPLGKHPANTYR
ncbi:hypothetical protein BH09PSE5_BH09PSE5_03440 [soil metagenome]